MSHLVELEKRNEMKPHNEHTHTPRHALGYVEKQYISLYVTVCIRTCTMQLGNTTTPVFEGRVAALGNVAPSD